MTDFGKKIKWAEKLPEKCPPPDATQPQNGIYYRLVESNPPTEKDFYSHRKLFPEKNYSSKECIASAVSIFNSLDRCKDIKKLPLHKDNNELIIKITLPPDSGLIKKTGGHHHFSWWRAKSFNPLPHCVFVGE